MVEPVSPRRKTGRLARLTDSLPNPLIFMLFAIPFMLLFAGACDPPSATSGTGAPSPSAPAGAPPTPPPTIDPSRFEQGTSPETIATYTAKLWQCERLPDPLVRLLTFPDPQRQARMYGMEFDGSRVKVAIRGAAGANLDALVRRYHLVEIVRGGDVMDAFVPLDTLCDLSNDEAIREIYIPRAPKPS